MQTFQQPERGDSCVGVVIPTYRRGAVLLETLTHLLELVPPPDEIVVVDQTEVHPPDVEETLQEWERGGQLRRLRISPPSIPCAMNAGLLQARGGIVLFLDDDLVPEPGLIAHHRQAHAEHPDAWAVVGQVLQPGEEPSASPPSRKGGSALRRDLDFAFNGIEPAWVENVMAGNLSVKRSQALAVGGFDENFIPPVSFRFETEFARRLVAAGGKIWFEPQAAIRHLRAGSGGTRARGGHMASASPLHGVGDTYYALRRGRGWDRLWHILKRPFREVCTKYHLRRPWWIPVKFIGELRALVLAIRLHRAGPKLLTTKDASAHE